MNPRENAPVTVLSEGLLVHGRAVLAPTARYAFLVERTGVAGIVTVGIFALNDEGGTWVRGHVTERDPLGAALLSAGALAAKPKALSLREAYENIIKDVHVHASMADHDPY